MNLGQGIELAVHGIRRIRWRHNTWEMLVDEVSGCLAKCWSYSTNLVSDVNLVQFRGYKYSALCCYRRRLRTILPELSDEVIVVRIWTIFWHPIGDGAIF
jgi:hypothetical protein